METLKLEFDEVRFKTVEEELGATTLSTQQKVNLKNLIVQTLNEKAFMPADTPNYLLKQEYSRGMLDAYTYLLQISSEAEQRLLELSGLAPGNSQT